MLCEKDTEWHRGLDDTCDVDGSGDTQFGPPLMVPDWHFLVYMREARDRARATLQAITLAWEEQWLKRTVSHGTMSAFLNCRQQEKTGEIAGALAARISNVFGPVVRH